MQCQELQWSWSPLVQHSRDYDGVYKSLDWVCQISLNGKTNIDNAQLGLGSEFLWAIAVALIRSSIILLYIRIFPPRSFHVACYVILALNGAFSISIAVTYCLRCHPIACQWQRDRLPCSCYAPSLFEAINAGFNLALDVTVVFLPTPMLWALQMPVRKKVLLSGMFGLGIL